MVALILGFDHQGYRIPQLASLALIACACWHLLVCNSSLPRGDAATRSKEVSS